MNKKQIKYDKFPTISKATKIKAAKSYTIKNVIPAPQFKNHTVIHAINWKLHQFWNFLSRFLTVRKNYQTGVVGKTRCRQLYTIRHISWDTRERGVIEVFDLKWPYVYRKKYIHLSQQTLSSKHFHCVKSVRIWSFSGPYFPVFRLNKDRYGVSLRIPSECGKIRTKKFPNTDTFHVVLISAI